MLDTNNSLISQFDYVISHFDGNNNDKDDIAALPMAALLTKAAGIEEKSTFFYGNNLGEPNKSSQVEAMRESAEFAEKLGIKTYDYQANTNAATDALVKTLNSGKEVLAIEGGPMEAIYRALEKTSPDNRKNVTLLSHSSWNENRDVASKPGVTDVRTWSDIKKDFPEVKLIEIADQNGKGDSGFNSSQWNWLDSTDEPLLQEARSLMKNAEGKVNDPSDSGMHFYAITGQETADPNDAKVFFQDNPPSVDGVSKPTTPPASSPDTEDKVYLASNGQVVIEAESTELTGDWEKVKIDNRDGVLYNGANSFNKVPQGQTLEYKFETDEGGNYNIALHSARDKSAMNEFRNDLGNDAFVSIENVETGEVIQQPTKLFTNFGSLNGEYRWGTTFDAKGEKSPAKVKLDPNTEYRLKIDGRSDGYVIDKITLSNDGFLKDADADPSEVKGKDSQPTPNPTPQPTPNPTPQPTPNPTPQPTPNPTPQPDNNSSLRLEAEDMELSGEYRVESIDVASDKKVISLRGGETEGTGEANFNFNGDTGKYNIKVNYFDENDGVGNLKLFQGSKQLTSIDLDKQLGSALADDKTLTTKEIKGVEIKAGDSFTLAGIEDGNSKTAEHARVDYIEFIPVEEITPASEPEQTPIQGEVQSGNNQEQNPNQDSSENLLNYQLVDADTNKAIASIEDGQILSASELQGKNLAVIATANENNADAEKIESVKFRLNDYQQVENLVPYSSFGDKEGNYTGKKLTAGDYKLEIQAYDADKAKGDLLGEDTINFKIAEDASNAQFGVQNISTPNEPDVFLGTNQADTFLLGNEDTSFYNDGQDNTLGEDSYGLIRNFNSQQGDVIQLAGQPNDYSLGASPQGLTEGQGIFLKTPGQDELVGIVQGANNLNLNSNSFEFV
ncbi:MAG: hypothetical protein AAF316_05555 [Cyanobacteria bacterium P01_A01_bin.80]